MLGEWVESRQRVAAAAAPKYLAWVIIMQQAFSEEADVFYKVISSIDW